MANERIKAAARDAGVYLWEIAEHLRMTDSAFSRKLRHELSDNEREQVLEVICKIKSMKGE